MAKTLELVKRLVFVDLSKSRTTVLRCKSSSSLAEDLVSLYESAAAAAAASAAHRS